MIKPLAIADPLLRMVCSDIPLREIRNIATQQIIEEMLDFVYGTNNKGVDRNRYKAMTIGLSANQVGIMKKISIVDFAIRRSKSSDIHAIINPKIVWSSKTTKFRREGCVNIPNIWGIVPRSSAIKVKYYDRWGNEVLMHAHGWQAVLLQHEIDHLNGILYIDRISDPTKAHQVNDEDLIKYRTGYKTWNTFIDITQWRKITHE